MGTGSVQVNYQQVPSGGFFNHNSGRRAPQGIRPVTKECIFIGDDSNPSTSLQQQIDEARSYLGVEDKLTIRFGNGVLRWQWATFAHFDAPIAIENQELVPVGLQWITAAQNWRTTIYSTSAWSWGDGSWVWGDGTVGFNQEGTEAVLTSSPQTIAVDHTGGSIECTDLVITVTPGTTSVTALQIDNSDTFQRLTYSATMAVGDLLVIDCGALSIRQRKTPVNISSITGNGTTATVVTSSVHGLSTGQDVYVDGTTTFDGLHTGITVTNTTTFTFPAYRVDTLATGTIRRSINGNGSLIRSDRRKWMSLKAATDNSMIVTVTGNASADATIGFAYSEHHA